MTVYQVPGYGFPGYHAECFQTTRMTEAFTRSGVDARIVYAWSRNALPWVSVRETYGLQNAPRRVILPAMGFGQGRFRLLGDATRWSAMGAFALAAGRASIFLGRHPAQAPLATLVRLKALGLLTTPLFVELHESQHFLPAADPHINGYIVIGEALRAFLIDAGVSEDRVLVAPNAVDLELYDRARAVGKTSLREQLAMPQDSPVVCYTGRLAQGRNIEALIAAVKQVDERVILVIVGGGAPSDLERITAFAVQQQMMHRLIMAGHQPAERAAQFQVASDVLAIPYSSRLRHAQWCSPLKVAEYLAAGSPIVAFPLPALRSVLSDRDVVWAREETPSSLGAAIEEALRRAPKAAEEIRARVCDWTWCDRAERIAAFMGQNGNPAEMAIQRDEGRN